MINKTIIFPNLHIRLEGVSDGIHIFGMDIAFYGLIIATAMLVGVILTSREAKREGIKTDDYLDIAIYAIIFGVIGARIYYVIFSWSYYRENLLDVFKIWEGGLAIYGGIILGAVTVYIVCRVKRLSFAKIADIAVFAVLIGQIAGRWGNFFNREAFGAYSDGLFAMLLPTCDVRSYSDITDEMLAHASYIDGQCFISVHPTFLYESFFNLCILLIILLFRKYKSFDGQLLLIYAIGYGILRFFVESLRTDQLLLANTHIPVSQFLSAIIVVVSCGLMIFNCLKNTRGNTQK